MVKIVQSENLPPLNLVLEGFLQAPHLARNQRHLHLLEDRNQVEAFEGYTIQPTPKHRSRIYLMRLS